MVAEGDSLVGKVVSFLMFGVCFGYFLFFQDGVVVVGFGLRIFLRGFFSYIRQRVVGSLLRFYSGLRFKVRKFVLEMRFFSGRFVKFLQWFVFITIITILVFFSCCEGVRKIFFDIIRLGRCDWIAVRYDGCEKMLFLKEQSM